MTEEPTDSGSAMLGLGGLAALFTLLSYPATGIVREVRGQRGIATSPLLVSPALWLSMLPLIDLEPRVRRRTDWGRLEPFWYGGGVVLGLGVPFVAGILTPLPVLSNLSRGVAGVLSFCAPPLVLSAILTRRRLGLRPEGKDGSAR